MPGNRTAPAGNRGRTKSITADNGTADCTATFRLRDAGTARVHQRQEVAL